jgi:hypothetical protein
MLKHRAVTQSRVADAETQRKPLPGPTMLKHKGSRYTVSGQQATKHQPSLLHKNADTKSAIPVAETARDLRC